MRNTHKFKLLLAILGCIVFLLPVSAIYGQTTYYSYQAGNWNNVNTWTTDPSGLTRINSAVPGNGASVVILNGKTVTINTTLATTGLNITIESGGVLNLATNAFGAPLASLNGSGKLRSRTSYFPAVASASNTFVSPTGGTVEYYNFSGALPINQTTYRHLVLNNTTATNQTMILANPGNITYTLNGDLRLSRSNTGTLALTIGSSTTEDNSNKVINLKIGDAALNIAANLRINEGTSLNVGQANVIHELTVNGNLVNNGNLDLSNAPQYARATAGFLAAANKGAANITFTGLTDNAVSGTGDQFDFYRLIVWKGTDQTYVLSLNTAKPNKFKLFAPTQPGNLEEGTENGVTYTRENPKINKALWIRSGTLKLGANIVIPKLTDAEDLNGDGKITINSTDRNYPNNELSVEDYFIPLAGALWIDGADVSITDIANNPDEMPVVIERADLTNPTASNLNSNCALTIIGKLKITNSKSKLNGNKGAGLVYRFTGETLVSAGEVNISQFRISTRASAGIVNKSSYVQTGGAVTVRGDNGTVSEVNADNSLFSIPQASSTFQMTGGVLNIHDVANNGNKPAPSGVFINSDAANSKVSGGVVNIKVNGNDNCQVSSTAPFQKLTISRFNTTGHATATLLAPLTINKDLIINSNATLNANNADVTIGGDFTIHSNGMYTPVNNTTRLNGTTEQTILLNHTNPANPTVPLFHNLTIAPNSTAAFSRTVNANTIMLTSGKLVINEDSKLIDGGLTFKLTGGANTGVFNAGEHAGNGSILFEGSAAQHISGTDGEFANISINNASGVALSGNHTINGVLRLANGVLAIANNSLSFGSSAKIYSSLAGTDIVFSKTKMILSAGSRSDGGIKVAYASTTGDFIFPMGTSDFVTDPNTHITSAIDKYTPITINVALTSPGTYGSVTVRPVNLEHPNVTMQGQSLKYYWRISSEGWTPGTYTAVHKNYTYTAADRQNPTTDYRPARYNSAVEKWAYGNNTYRFDAVNLTAIPNFNTAGTTFIPALNESLIDGEFTAGNPVAFGEVPVYYSRKSGNWDNRDTWSTVSHTGPAVDAAIGLPKTNSPVYIGDGNTLHHKVVVSTNNKVVGSMQIAGSSTIDLGVTTGHNFGYLKGKGISGTGTMQISSATGNAQFPNGDFGDFIGENGGTVEYYTTGINFTLPTEFNNGFAVTPLQTYRTLVLNAATANTVLLPNLNASGLEIYDTLIVGETGGFSGLVNFNTGQYGDVTIGKTLLVKRGSLQFLGTGQPRSITIKGDILVDADGILEVKNEGNINNHHLYIAGNLINNGIFKMDQASRCQVHFRGETAAKISGNNPAASTSFDKVWIEKGSSQQAVLTLDGAGSLSTPASGWLHLVNGTFRFAKASTIVLSNTASAFPIPATACLSVDHQQAVITVGNVDDNNADLFLAGKLEIVNGNVFIGNAAFNRNNDIEYAGAGQPAIVIKGGNLYVNGQIRRSLSNQLGALTYQQTGGNLIIYGKAQQNTRAKLEVLNEGSIFDMSDGTITIVKGEGGVAFGDLYLRPAASTVTGGTIILANGQENSQMYRVDATIPLFNMQITGTSITKTATASLNVNPLALSGTLTISNSNSILEANGRNLAIGGDFINAGMYRPGLNTTIFNGISSQAITLNSETAFYHLTIDKLPDPVSAGSVVSFAGTQEPTINRTLAILNGILDDNGKTVLIKGNIINNALHQSAGTGKIKINSGSTTDLSQVISGIGSFGRLEVDDVNNVVTKGAITVNTELVLSNGSVDIGDKLFTLGVNATVTGVSAARHIRTNGVLSDAGLRKLFAAGTGNFSFVWPLGTIAGFTPAHIGGTASITQGGGITIKPINDRHPATTDNLNATELKYFWSVSSNGFTNLTATHQYTYLDPMVQGNETAYLPARYDHASSSWTYGVTGDINGANNTIGNTTFTTYGFRKFSDPATINSYYLDGDYTAGAAPEFREIPVYYSINSGDWTNPASWSTVSHTGPAATTYPVGQPVEIAQVHAIQATGLNRCYAASVKLAGTLNLKEFSEHNLGVVTGSGKIIISSEAEGATLLFPAGDYSQFVSTSGGTFEFNSSTAEVMMPSRTTYNHISFTGSSIKHMAQVDLEVRGNWVNESGGATLFSDDNMETVTFNGAGQLIKSTKAITFNNLVISGGGIKNLQANIIIDGIDEISGKLMLENGILHAGSSFSVFVKKANIAGGSIRSFVSGPLAQTGVGNMFFPVGDISKTVIYRPVMLRNVKGDMPVLQAQHFDYDPDGRVDLNISPASSLYINNISKLRHWEIKEITTDGSKFEGASATFSYDPIADIAPVPAELRMAKTFNPDNVRNGVYRNISASNGADAVSAFAGLSSITSNEFTSFSFFALASIQMQNNPLPVHFVYVKAKQQDKSVVIDWATASQTNNDYFEVERSTDKDKFEYIGRVAGSQAQQQIHTYAFTDIQLPVAGVVYYRIKQVDLDGKYEYSKVVAVNITQDNGGVSRWTVYPNPLSGAELQIDLKDSRLNNEDTYTFSLYNMNGQIVYVQKTTIAAALNNLRSILSSSPNCLYFLQISTPLGLERFKLLKQ